MHIPGAIGTLFILSSLVIALFSYFIAPDNSPSANQMHLELSTINPGAKVNFLKIKKKHILPSSSWGNILLYGELKPYTLIPISSYDILNESTIAYCPFNSSHIIEIQISDLYEDNLGSYEFEKVFYLGTDKYGRDLLSRVILGTRVSFSVGFVSVLISVFIGIILGMISGYYGGKLDIFICWLINVVWSIPTFLLVIAISIVLGKGFWQVFAWESQNFDRLIALNAQFFHFLDKGSAL